MAVDLVTTLLPVLGRTSDLGFNVFDVMHHGLHEKQISNFFRWLLDAGGTHNLGDRFAKIFIDELNHVMVRGEPLPHDGYLVRQEVNTSPDGIGGDIADLVLASNTAVIVIENYFTSDGHGHSYNGYLEYSQREGRRGMVVLLCRDEDRSLQTKGWENAPVVTYGQLVHRLHDELSRDRIYQRKNPEAFSFIDQMHRKFVKRRGRMEDHDVLNFLVVMCETGEARRYQDKRPDVAAKQFAGDLEEQARLRFSESRELLRQIKQRVQSFGASTLKHQLNDSLGDGFVRKVSARYAGIYQWTVNFDVADDGINFGEARLQLKFGPSAWFANEQDPNWKRNIDPADADYSRLFITRATLMEVRQSVVTLQEVLDGLEPTDRRLHDEIVAFMSDHL